MQGVVAWCCYSSGLVVFVQPLLPSLPSPFIINLSLQFWCHSFIHKFQVIGSKSKVAIGLHLSFALTLHLCCACSPCLKITKKKMDK